MDFTLKTEKIKKTTVQITLDRLRTDTYSEKEIKALFVLLGGYNVYGRSIELKEHRENIIKFKNLIEKIAKKL